MEMEKVGSIIAPSILESETGQSVEFEMDPELKPDTAIINNEKQYEDETTEKGRVSRQRIS